MPFKKFLGPLTEQISSEAGAILVDSEGEVVDMAGKGTESYQLQVTAAHSVILSLQFQALAAKLGGGDLEELRLTTDGYQVLIIPVDRDYFLVFYHRRDMKNADRARAAAGHCALAIRKELF